MKKEKLAIVFLIIIYAVGLIGIGTEIFPDMKSLTPINLLLSAAICISFQKDKNKLFWIFCFGIYLSGYFIEVIGVQTGKIFGVYTYGTVLGPKIFNTPLMIGVNWLLLVYCCGHFVNQLWSNGHFIVKSILGASILALLDLLIEPIAVDWGMWTWEQRAIPLQNYLAWWSIGFIMLLFFYKILGRSTNIVATSVLILQWIFFGLLNL